MTRRASTDRCLDEACSSAGPSRPSPSCSAWPVPTTGRRPRSAGRSRASTRHRRRGCPAAARWSPSSRSTTRSGPIASRSPPAPRSCGRTSGATITTSRPPTAPGESARSRSGPGATYSHVFTEPGEVTYYCTIHGTADAGMVGHHCGDRLSPRRVAASDARRRRGSRDVEGVDRRRARCDRAAHGPGDRRRHARRCVDPSVERAVRDRAGAGRRPAPRSPFPPTTRRSRPPSTPPRPATSSWSSPGTYHEAVNVTTDEPHDPRARPQRGDPRRRASSSTTASACSAPTASPIENMTAMQLHRQRLLLDRRRRLPRLVPHAVPHRRLRHLRLRLDARPARPLLRRRQPRRRLLHRPVLPVRRRDRRRRLGAQRPRLLRHQLRRQPADRQLDVPQQPRRHRAQLAAATSCATRSATPRSSATSSTPTTRRDTPAIDVALLAMGNGILVGRRRRATSSERNRVYDHDKTGIGLVPFLEEGAARRHPAGRRDRPRRAPTSRNDPVEHGAARFAAVGRARQRRRGQRALRQPHRRPRRGVARVDPSTLGNCFADNDVHDVGAERPRGARAVRRRRTGRGQRRLDGEPARRGVVARARSPTARPPCPTTRPTCPRWSPRRTCPTPPRPRPIPATDMPRAVDVDAIGVPDAPADAVADSGSSTADAGTDAAGRAGDDRRVRRRRLAVGLAAAVAAATAFGGPSASAAPATATATPPTSWWPVRRAASGQFIVACDWSHASFDDPIVHAGMEGMSHRHEFFGNTTTDADSTYESLLAGDTTCAQKLDRAAYWVPSLLDGEGRVVQPARCGRLLPRRPRGGPHDGAAVPARADDGGRALRRHRPPAAQRGGVVVRTRRRAVLGAAAVRRRPGRTAPAGSRSPTAGTAPASTATTTTPTSPTATTAGAATSTPCRSRSCSSPSTTHRRSGGPFSLASGPIETAHADFWNAWDEDKLADEVDLCLHRDLVCGISRTDNRTF